METWYPHFIPVLVKKKKNWGVRSRRIFNWHYPLSLRALFFFTATWDKAMKGCWRRREREKKGNIRVGPKKIPTPSIVNLLRILSQYTLLLLCSIFQPFCPRQDKRILKYHSKTSSLVSSSYWRLFFFLGILHSASLKSIYKFTHPLFFKVAFQQSIRSTLFLSSLLFFTFLFHKLVLFTWFMFIFEMDSLKLFYFFLF